MRCPKCEGRGYMVLVPVDYNPNKHIPVRDPCTECYGVGAVIPQPELTQRTETDNLIHEF